MGKSTKMDKKVKEVVDKAVDRGWFLDRISKHYIYKHPKGGCVTVSISPSDVMAYKNIEKDFLREESKFA